MGSAKRNPMMVLLAGAWFGCATAWALPPAGDAVQTRTEIVKFQASQASTPEGAAQLYARLKVAADRVCAELAGSIHIALAADPGHAVCVRDALGRAVDELRLPMVSVIHLYGPQGPAMVSR
jgi:UrcA family protein